MNELALNLDLRCLVGLSAPCADGRVFFFEIGQQNNSTVLGGNDFEDQAEQFALQKLRVANRVDDVADSEECGQIARHAPYLDAECRGHGRVFHSQHRESGVGRAVG